MSTKPGPDMSEPYHQDVKQVVQEQSEPFVTTSDVAEVFPDVSHRTIRKRLNDLVDQGKLRCREIGANSKVWYE